MAVIDIPDLGVAAALSATDQFVLTQGSAIARRVTLLRIASAVQALSDAASKTPARAATTVALAANAATATTLTATANGAFPAIDGITLNLGQYALVKNEVATQNNGLYELTQVGSGGTPWILTRSDDMDTWAEVPGATVVVTEGSTLADTVWVTTSNESGVLGTTAISWIQLQSFSAKTAALASATWAADKMFRTTSASGVVMDTVTAAARALLDDANVAAMLVTLGALAKAGDTMTGVLTIDFSGGVMPAPPTFTTLHVKGALDSGTRLLVDTMGTSIGHAPNVAYRWARNSAGSPSAALSGDILGLFSWFGYGATAYGGSARAQMRCLATETWTDTLQGTRLTFSTTATGTVSTTEKLGIENDGSLSMGGSSNIVIDANRHVRLRSYTVATLPSASPSTQMIYVSDGTANKRLAVSDGTNWRFPDGNVVS